MLTTVYGKTHFLSACIIFFTFLNYNIKNIIISQKNVGGQLHPTRNLLYVFDQGFIKVQFYAAPR